MPNRRARGESHQVVGVLAIDLFVSHYTHKTSPATAPGDTLLANCVLRGRRSVVAVDVVDRHRPIDRGPSPYVPGARPGATVGLVAERPVTPPRGREGIVPPLAPDASEIRCLAMPIPPTDGTSAPELPATPNVDIPVLIVWIAGVNISEAIAPSVA